MDHLAGGEGEAGDTAVDHVVQVSFLYFLVFCFIKVCDSTGHINYKLPSHVFYG